MLKNILKLDGAQQLSNNEQKEIVAGKLPPSKACGGVGYVTTVNACLCNNGGQYNYATMTCSNGQPNSGKIYENATGCCYNNLNVEL